MDDPIYTAEILTNKKRIIEVRPIFILLIRFFWLIIIAIPDFRKVADMQKARNDAIEAQQNRTVALSSSLDNAFKPMHTTASPATVATTSSGPNLDPDWTSPVAVTSMSHRRYSLQSGVPFFVESFIKRQLHGETEILLQITCTNAMVVIRI